MGQANLNRQFVPLDFEDLDNPTFIQFLRSPESSTYWVMRRCVWHSMRSPYRLYCSLSRSQMAAYSGGQVSERTITTDIARLVAKKIIEVISTGREPIYVLGNWCHIEGVYTEVFFLKAYVQDRKEGTN